MLLLRRLRLPLPPVSRTCQCGRPTDVLGHHRAACARAGVLGWRGFVLESAAARVSRRRRQSILQRHGERSGLEGARRARRSSPRSRRLRTSVIWRGHNWPSTPPWFPLCIVTDAPDLTQPTFMAWHCRREDGGKNSHNPNSKVHAAGPGWWFSQARWVDTGQPRPCPFLGLLAKARARSETHLKWRRVEQAWRIRWSCMLACAAARAFAASLLEQRMSIGCDGNAPVSHEVVADHRYAGLG